MVVNGDEVFSSHEKIFLKSGQKWDEVVTYQPSKAMQNLKIEFILAGDNSNPGKISRYTYIDVMNRRQPVTFFMNI